MNTTIKNSKMMSYELIYILRPDLDEEVILKMIEKYEYLLSNIEAKNITVQNRGRRQLSYPIKRFQDGIYVQVYFEGNGEILKTIKKTIKISDEIIRYMIVRNVK